MIFFLIDIDVNYEIQFKVCHVFVCNDGGATLSRRFGDRLLYCQLRNRHSIQSFLY